MPEEVASAVFNIKEEGSSAVQSALDGLTGGLSAVASVAAGVAAAGLLAFAGAATFAIGEAMAAEGVFAQTANVIESTGGAAGMSAEQIGALAGSLAEVTPFADDAIQSAENLLLTFTNVGSETFPAATQAILDLSTSLGMDLNSAAMMVGKALNDPIAGITAMNRAGVQLTEAQKATIASLVEMGDTAGAQAIILEELNRQVGGSAEAAGQTAAGQWEIFKNQISNIAETIGLTFLPALTGIGNMLEGPVMAALSAVTPFFEEVGNAVSYFVALIGDGATPAYAFERAFRNLLPPDLVEQISGVITVVQEAFAAFQSGDVGGGLAALLPPELADAVMSLLSSFQELGASVQSTFPAMQQSGQQFAEWLPSLLPSVVAVIENIATAVSNLAAIWEQWGPTVIPVVTTAVEIVIATLVGLVTIVSGIVGAFTQLLTGDFSGAWETIVSTTAAFVGSITNIFGQSLPEFQATWKGNWDLFLQIVQGIGTLITTAVTTTVSNISNGLRTGLETALNQMLGLKDQFFSVGKALVQGMIDGLEALASAFIQKLVNMVLAAVAAAKSVLGIESPSKVTREMGVNTGEGLALGIDSTAQRVMASMTGLTGPVLGAGPSLAMPQLPAMPSFSSGDPVSNLIHVMLEVPLIVDGRELGRASYDGVVEEGGYRGQQMVPVT